MVRRHSTHCAPAEAAKPPLARLLRYILRMMPQRNDLHAAVPKHPRLILGWRGILVAGDLIEGSGRHLLVRTNGFAPPRGVRLTARRAGSLASGLLDARFQWFVHEVMSLDDQGHDQLLRLERTPLPHLV